MQLRASENSIADLWSGCPRHQPARYPSVATTAAADGARRGVLPIWQARLGAKATYLAIATIGLLIALRVLLAAVLPLSFDEAYYWLWSKHLASGYLEHPALIAFAIRAGTFFLGDSELGVRSVALLVSVIASFAVWRSASTLFKDNQAGVIAALLFNCTLMVAAEGMGATPDSLLIAAAALLLLTIAELERSQDGRWWLAAGFAAGMAVAAKYTGLFLCVSVAIWLCQTSLERRAQSTDWLRTFWPYAGGAIALAMFLPTLDWNMTHGFMSFGFQSARAVAGHVGWLNLLQFLGSQCALASPGILLLAGIGFRRVVFSTTSRRVLLFVVTMIWPAAVFFVLHALHDRVQGNWPCFLYPALAILAAGAYRTLGRMPSPSRAARFVRASTIPTAILILFVTYTQAFFGVFALGRNDPIARMMGVGLTPVANGIASEVASTGARAIVTTNYPVTSWLRFYLRTRIPIVQISDERRFLSSPQASQSAFGGTLLYVTQNPERELPSVSRRFYRISLLRSLVRSRGGHAIDTFALFAVAGFHGGAVGRMP